MFMHKNKKGITDGGVALAATSKKRRLFIFALSAKGTNEAA